MITVAKLDAIIAQLNDIRRQLVAAQSSVRTSSPVELVIARLKSNVAELGKRNMWAPY